MVQEQAGLRFIHHDGDTFGQDTEFLLAPDRQFAFALLTNSDRAAHCWRRSPSRKRCGRIPGLPAGRGRSVCSRR
jgi:hypothetical protein